MATGEENKQDDVVAIELPSPAGWVKKFSPKKGGTPQRNDIVFISPTGEEIKNRRQLDQYLKSHPGGPAATDFDWGTGDTPRRSARLSEKSKAPEGSTSFSPKKMRKKSSPKGIVEKSNADEEGKTQETKEVADVDTNEAGDSEFFTKEAIPEKPDNKNVGTETETETELVLDEPSAAETQNDAETENSNANFQKFNGVAPEIPSVAETHYASNTENFNANDENFNSAINNEPKEALLEKEASDGKVGCAKTIVKDKNDPKEEQGLEQPVENDAVFHEQAPTLDS